MNKIKITKKLLFQIVFGIATTILFGILSFKYFNQGESRVLMAYLFIFALPIGVYGTFSRFNRLHKISGSERKQEIRRQKLFAELASAISLFGLAISVWLIYANIDSLNREAKAQHLTNASITLKKELTNEFCISKPYRQQWCDNVGKSEQELFWLIISGENKEITNKARMFQLFLDSIAKDSEPKMADALIYSKSELTELIGFDENYRILISSSMLSILLLTGYMAISRKLACAWSEHLDPQ